MKSKSTFHEFFRMFLCQQKGNALWFSSSFVFFLHLLTWSVPGFNSDYRYIAVILLHDFQVFPFQLPVRESVLLESLSPCFGFPFFHAVMEFATCSHTELGSSRGNARLPSQLRVLLSTLHYARRMRPYYFETLEGGKYSTQKLCNLST